MSISTKLVKSALSLLILQVFLVSKALADDCDDYYYSYCDDVDLAVGVIIAIIVGVLIFFIIIIVLLCYLCACCCFIGRRGKTRGQVYAPPTPITIQGASAPGVTVVNSAYQPSGYYPNQPPQYAPQYQPQQFQQQQSTPYPLHPQQQAPQYPPQPQPQRY